MTESKKTKQQIIKEIAGLRKKIASLEKSEAKFRSAEEAIRTERDKLQTLMDGLASTEIGIDIVGIDYNVIFQNPVLKNRFGDIVGEFCYEKYMGLKKPCDFCPMIKAVKNRKVEMVELTGLDGRNYEITLAPLTNPDGSVSKAIEIIQDITERKQAEEELRKHRDHLEDLVIERTAELKKINEKLQEEISERKHLETKYRDSEEIFRRMTSSAAKDAIIMLDNEGNISYWNKAAKKIFGYSEPEALRKECHLLIGPKRFYDAYRKGFTEFKKSGKGPVLGKTLELMAVKKDGSEFPIELSVSAVNLRGKWNAIGIVRDITERKEMEKKLMRQEKLAILGQLAGGVGHELRNPLGAIKNAAYFLNMALEKPEQEVKETLELLEKEVSTSERIISSLLGFAHPKPPLRHKVNVNEIIDEVSKRNKIPGRIKVEVRLTKTLPSIIADPVQLTQVFGNLVLNSIQAMPEGGVLVIETNLDNRKYVVASFADTGNGIHEDILEKLFEPLFTTKAKGIGLGLAVSKTLVEGHGGTIEVESTVGKGSTFTVKLPIRPKSK
jgi:two-component system sensor kinase FixL